MSEFVTCKGKTVDDCFKCGLYYSSHSSHYDKVYKKEIISITCFYGHSGEYDAETRKRID